MTSIFSFSALLRFSFALLLFLFMRVPAHALDLNNATKAQLRSIKGIGDKTADRILSIRKQGRFLSLDDFGARVPGFGPKKLHKLRTQGVTVGSPAGISYSRGDDTAHSAFGSQQAVSVSIQTESGAANPGSGRGRQGARATVHRNEATASSTPAMPMLIRPQPRKDASATSQKLPAADTQEGDHQRPVEQTMTP